MCADNSNNTKKPQNTIIFQLCHICLVLGRLGRGNFVCGCLGRGCIYSGGICCVCVFFLFSFWPTFFFGPTNYLDQNWFEGKTFFEPNLFL